MERAPKYMAVQGAALIVAVALTVFGVLGFVPGVTSGLAEMRWAGQQSGALLFGVFLVSVLLNTVHVVVGIAGFAGSRSYAWARAYLVAGGAIYLALWLYGILVEHGSNAHVIPLNSADNWLHGILGAVMVILAVTLAGQHDPTKRRPRMRRAASH